MKRHLWLGAAAIAAIGTLGATASANLIYDQGHGDLEFNFVDEGAGLEWEGKIHTDQHGHTNSDAQIIRLDLADHWTTDGVANSFFGTAAGTGYFRIWQDVGDAPTFFGVDLGWSAEETALNLLDNNQVFVQLTGNSGPGDFVLWREGFTTPTMSTVDGITSSDTLTLRAGSHLHRNFGFSKAGTYHLTFKPYGFINGQLSEGEEFTYTVEAVPEPGTLAALAAGTALLLRRRRNRA